MLLGDGADAIDLGGQGSTDIAEVVDWTVEWGRIEAIIPSLPCWGWTSASTRGVRRWLIGRLLLVQRF